jgi:hypothetical protein
MPADEEIEDDAALLGRWHVVILQATETVAERK